MENNDIIGRCKPKSHQSIFKTDDDNVVTEPGSISNSFNNFFVNIGSKPASNINILEKITLNFF